LIKIVRTDEATALAISVLATIKMESNELDWHSYKKTMHTSRKINTTKMEPFYYARK
jgi:hypothetical protein